MQWGTQYAVGMQYTVGKQYTVGVSAKRSTHTVDLANMGGPSSHFWVILTQPDISFSFEAINVELQ